MDKQETARPKEMKDSKSDKTAEACVDESKQQAEADGKNDSGPEPEVHGREIPPQR